MNALLGIASFEVRNRLRQVSTYVYFLVYAAMAALWMAAAGGAFAQAHVVFGSDKIFINSPDALAAGITVLGFLGVSVIAAAMGRAIQQDYEYGTWHFFFTAPIRKRDYFIGRFLGAWVVLILAFLGIAAGLYLGIHWPGVDPSRVGPTSLQSFLRPYLFELLPNMLWLGGIFFVVAALTRQMAPAYVGGVVVLIGYLLGVNLLHDMENKDLAGLIDPIGLLAQRALVRYWSVADKNTRQITLSDALLWNRLLWLGVGGIVTLVGYRMFRMEAVSLAGRKGRTTKAGPASPVARSSTVRLPAVTLEHGTAAWLRALPAMVGLYARTIFTSPVFLLIVLGGAIYMIASSATMGDVVGTSTWPVTWQVLEATTGFFGLFVLIVTAIYAGELVWRERETRIDEIVDATPQPLWLPFAAKLLTLALVQAVLMGIVMLSCVLIQLWYHYTRLELGHSFYELFLLQLPDYLILGALALTVHVLVNNKYVAHFVVVAGFIVQLKLPDFGYEDRLYLYGSRPDVVYSDMNGYGHFLPAVRSFQLYWAAAAVLLLVLSYRLWVRGREDHWRARLALASTRGTAPVWATSAVAALGMAGTGAWIFYNTHVLNHFRSAHDDQALQAEYEKRYKAYEFAAQPSVSGADFNVDLYPHEHRADLRGHYALINRSTQPISDLYMGVPEFASVRSIRADIPLTLADADPQHWWWHYHLARPLQPGESTGFDFDIGYATHGFKNNGAAHTVIDNGSFLNGALGNDIARLPGFGYSDTVELESDNDRRKFGLKPKERLLDLDDPRARQLGPDWSDHYSATLSTEGDQIAITSGTLTKDWVEHGAAGDRHYYHYELDRRLLGYTPFLSGRYAVRRDQWTGRDQKVDIEINYQPGHEFNLDRMIAGVKDSLDYYTQHFSPYQFSNLRIIEFPRYDRFAESFPNTVPFSESIGFIARVDDKDPTDLDYPYFVTAHEVAHQWWAHQAIGAHVQGEDFLVESLAEYSALMVLKHKYGDARMHRFLRYELDRYLTGRGLEQKKEQPLMRADGPTYLHYAKGSLALYALQDVIGEDAMNQALSSFVNEWRFKGPPYPISRDLVAEFYKVTPADRQYAIADLLESITLYDLQAKEAQVRALPDGKFEVTLTATAKKFQADGLGKETEVTLSESIDVGALDDDKQPIHIEKQIVHAGENRIAFITDRKPARVGIDPLNKLIDRVPDDNIVAVKSDKAD